MIPLRDHNPSRTAPVVTVVLIAINVFAFGYEVALGARLGGFLATAAFIPARIFAPGPDGGDLQLTGAVLSMFLHGGFLHIAGNMLFLWIFGDNIEDRFGHFRFLAFFLLCGLAATYAHALANPASAVPAIGASGAIAGVLGAYLLLFPTARISSLLILGFFVRIVEVPAYVYLALWFLMQLFSGLLSLGDGAASGGVAWFAHIGGFIAGPLLLLLFGGRRSPRRHARASW
jgi:membrane associated rhomboid family serine protease